jgi:hypothetical protein
MFHFLEKCRFVNALPPVADAFDGTVWPAGVNLAEIGRACFVVQKGVGVTGTSTLTLLAGDDNSPTNFTAIPFHYRRIGSNNTTIGAVTAAAAAGFDTTAGSGDMYILEVDAQALANTGYKYLHLKAVEVVNSPVLLGVIFIGTDLRFADSTADIVS